MIRISMAKGADWMNIEGQDALRISSRLEALDLDMIHDFLANQSYWARGIPRATLERALRNSLCFGGFEGDRQVAFARVVTDRATFANLLDVFVLPTSRGRGYGKVLVAAVMAHPELQGLRRFMLATSDAHALYERFGFAPPARPQTLMERYVPDIYQTGSPQS
jgi:GNAT superfamily N-acetyltransferase